MDMIFVVCVLILCGCYTIQGSFQDCFRRDSISCLQAEMYKAARKYLDNSTIEIVSGISLIKEYGNEGKSLEQKEVEENVERARDVQGRQQALETYLISAVENLWKERTIAWNPVQTARALVGSIPDTVTSQLTSFVSEARGKKKKQLQMLVPLLIALKLKFFTLASISGMIIALLAKKAILAAAVSLVLSGVTGIKSLIGTSKPTTHATEVMGYQAPGDWDPTMFGTGGYANYGRGDLLSSSNEPAPQQQVFIGHKAS